MLFNSIEFLAFLALVIALHRVCFSYGPIAQKSLLVGASLLFYAWFRADYVLLVLGSILFNFALGQEISRRARRHLPNGVLLAGGIAANLALLAYYKYAAFSVGSIAALLNLNLSVPEILLPIAISFFTFQQIAFLVDASKGEVSSFQLLDYMLFVTFFPQLIAGPIVHHKEMMPQFARPIPRARHLTDLTAGLTIFAMGLFKKVAIADNLAPYADVVFGAAEGGTSPGLLAAWSGALCYTLQLYFDFSGYSDMAVGLARVFGIRLPANFFSPYKAASIIDFWRRWHITLSRFLRDYLYIPLGGGRRGSLRRYVNLMITMLLGGLWHGAGWTFVAWGALHGIYLITNHTWRAFCARLNWNCRPSRAARLAGTAITFLAVVIAWVPFRAETFEGAWLILESMAGQSSTEGIITTALRPVRIHEVLMLLTSLIAVWSLPNTIEIMAASRPVIDPSGIVAGNQGVPKYGRKWRWRPNLAWGSALALTNGLTLFFFFENEDSPFLYFQF